MAQAKCTTTHDAFHECECYGHDLELPDYKHDISIPHTLQGYYAKKGGCPCPNKATCPHNNIRCCPVDPATCDNVRLTQSYRSADGPHPIHPQRGEDGGRDPATGQRTHFPNAKNYGGTVAQRGPTTLTTTAQLRVQKSKQRAERAEEKLQDRKNFLKACLRDEMLARADAEAKRGALEQDLGLMGTQHAVDFEHDHGVGAVSGYYVRKGMLERGIDEIPPVSEQYEEVMEELRFVAGQPVGSKYNVIRLHYLVEEEERIKKLRTQDKINKSMGITK